ncbi:MAG: hypothetical protein M3441_29140 [Chloroflexota bacterium]|jgi:hypothetical protein|nr:hypothetical protein [Chloroflexota bacterium]
MTDPQKILTALDREDDADYWRWGNPDQSRTDRERELLRELLDKLERDAPQRER